MTLNTLLPPQTHLGYVHLTVKSLERSLPFYQQVMGFQLHGQAGATATLGAGGDTLLALTENPAARRVPNTSGLYHFAILVPSRRALAASLAALIHYQIRIGGGDHLVSEAIYFSDPDGNGIEVYADRPRSEWYTPDGAFRMGTDPLDYEGILSELGGQPIEWHGLEAGTVLGHMHLHVGHLGEAQRFYQAVIGFDLMMNWGSAAFVSAGGYHHHLGMNTWAGVGAPPAPPDAVGLRYFTVHLPDTESRRELLARFEDSGTPHAETDSGLDVADPFGNHLRFVVGG